MIGRLAALEEKQDSGAANVRALAAELAEAERVALRTRDRASLARVIEVQRRLTAAVRSMPVRVGLGTRGRPA